MLGSPIGERVFDEVEQPNSGSIVVNKIQKRGINQTVRSDRPVVDRTSWAYSACRGTGPASWIRASRATEQKGSADWRANGGQGGLAQENGSQLVWILPTQNRFDCCCCRCGRKDLKRTKIALENCFASGEKIKWQNGTVCLSWISHKQIQSLDFGAGRQTVRGQCQRRRDDKNVEIEQSKIILDSRIAIKITSDGNN